MRFEPTKERADAVIKSPTFMKRVMLASPDINKEMWEIADRSKPNDFIRLTHEEMEKLERLWLRFLPPGHKEERFLIPSDLLIAGTIPMSDMILELDMDGDGKQYRFRIVIFEDYKEIIDRYFEKDEKSAVIVGICTRQFTEPGTGNEIGFPITIQKGEDYINNTEIMYYRNVPNGRKQDAIPQGLAFLLQSGALSIWYGIQIALLNPVTKDAFVRAGKAKYRDARNGDNGSTYKKGPTRYIKVSRLHEGNFDRLIKGTGQPRERHTLAWRVIGHWRHYQNGKTVFIKPYWKGLMKDIKKEDCRERRIVIPEEGKEND